MSEQYINIRAFRWAREQDVGKTEKIVLIEYALGANEKGYSYPSIENIAFTWGMDRETVRRAREALLVRRKLFGTKKRVGDTGRVKVFRLPKIAYENGGQFHPFENKVIGGKSADKRRINGGESAQNKEEGIRNKKEEGAATLGDGPLAPAVNKVLSSIFLNSSLPSPPKKEGSEHPWREQARDLYPGTDVEHHILRIEQSARKRGITNLRAYGLACLKKHPPSKMGEKPKRKLPKIDYEAELKASQAKFDKEDATG